VVPVEPLQPVPGMPKEKNSWFVANENGSWATEKLRLAESNRGPINTLYAQAPGRDLVFLYNGIISNGSGEQAYPKMMVINTRTNEVRTVSTETISPSAARVGAVFQYLPLMGQKGALLLFGGATRREHDNGSMGHNGTSPLLRSKSILIS
jgi:hypothetical protein